MCIFSFNEFISRVVFFLNLMLFSFNSNTAFVNTPSTVELHDTSSKPHTLQVKVLAAEETWQTPSLLLATDAEGGGKALFSQVFLSPLVSGKNCNI